MREYVVIEHNPSKQKKIFKISFKDSEKNYKGCLISFELVNTIIKVYRTDQGVDIQVQISEKKE